MSFLDRITPIVITWNERQNVERVFSRLSWAREVVVVDSGSDDRTLELLGGYPNVRAIVRPFVSHADQVNFALREAEIGTEWVLSLDADYVLSDSLIRELATLSPGNGTTGFEASFEYWVLGQPLRASLYPPRVVLFRAGSAHYIQEGHAHRLRTSGRVETLRSRIAHDDRKPLSRWVRDQERYATVEARRLTRTPFAELDWPDRLRAGSVAPVMVAVYCLFGKLCILEGRVGLYYTLQRVVAESLLALRLWELRAGLDGG